MTRHRQYDIRRKQGAAASLHRKPEVLDWHHENGGSQSRTAKHFQAPLNALESETVITQPLVSSWLKAEAQIREKAKHCFFVRLPTDRMQKA